MDENLMFELIKAIEKQSVLQEEANNLMRSLISINESIAQEMVENRNQAEKENY